MRVALDLGDFTVGLTSAEDATRGAVRRAYEDRQRDVRADLGPLAAASGGTFEIRQPGDSLTTTAV
jgi:hypothetical protein